MSYRCSSNPLTAAQNSDNEHQRMTIQTGCECLHKYIWHSKVVRALYICTVAPRIDWHRLTNSGMSPSVILKMERRVVYRLCDCNQHSDVYIHNK